MSIDEEKKSTKSETNSHTSGKKSNTSSQKKTYVKKEKQSKVDKLAQKYKIKYDNMEDIDQNHSEEEEEEIDHKDNKKKMVHFEDTQDHIELKDLSEKDFVDLIASKNQDTRFYGWLHFGPLDNHKEKSTDPIQDLEFFDNIYGLHES